MNLVVVDTDILIDVGAGEMDALRSLELLKTTHDLAITVITQMELLVGCRNKREQSHLEKFIQQFEILHPSVDSSQIAVNLIKQFRLSHNMRMADAMIAGIALDMDTELASKNQKDYRFIPNLKLLPYPIV